MGTFDKSIISTFTLFSSDTEFSKIIKIEGQVLDFDVIPLSINQFDLVIIYTLNRPHGSTVFNAIIFPYNDYD